MAIRTATTQDARAIADVHVRTWDVAYRGVVPDAVIDAATVEKREAKWHEVLSGTRGPVFVSEEDGNLIGFLALSLPSRDDDATPTTAELAGLYVDPAHWRGGTGSSLVAAALDWLVADGRWDEIVLWLLEQNARAHAFYDSQGFAPDGARGEWKGLPDIRLRRPLLAGAER